MRDDTWYETHPRALTDTEVDERATKMAKSIREYEVEEEKEKARAKTVKEGLADDWSKIRALREQVESRKEPREVEVKEEVNEVTRSVMAIRQDTGEVLRTRQMTAEELQRSLPGLGKKKRGKLLALDGKPADKAPEDPDDPEAG